MNGEGGTVFCGYYQKGTCSQTSYHWGFFMGERRLLKHICGKCWLDNKKIELHPRNADDCPSKWLDGGDLKFIKFRKIFRPRSVDGVHELSQGQ